MCVLLGKADIEPNYVKNISQNAATIAVADSTYATTLAETHGVGTGLLKLLPLGPHSIAIALRKSDSLWSP